jgi:hypothetical protein
VFLHCFKQRALRFGSRAIYLIDQHDLRKQRAAMKHEALLASIEDGIAENIGGKQVTRKLDALERESERASQRLGERCLAHARNIFNQEVASREQTGDGELHRLILAYDNFTNLLCERVNVLRHSEMICGNDAFRKRYAEKDLTSWTVWWRVSSRAGHQRVLLGVDVGGLKRGLSRVGLGETNDGWASR